MTPGEQRSEAELEDLRRQLDRLGASFSELSGEHGRLDVGAFQQALELRSEFVARHLFRLFDGDGDGALEHGEFIAAVERLIGGSHADKLSFLFRYHDQDEDGRIERLELERLIHLGLAESSLALPDRVVDSMVDAVFEAGDVDGDGCISLEEFTAVFERYPELLERVTRPHAVWRALRGGAAAKQTQQRRGVGARLAHWIRGHRAQFVFLVVYALINLVLFTEAGLRYRAAGETLLVQLARGCGACLNFNCALILVPMLRYTLSWVRAGPLGRVLPVDHSVAFHKLIGHVVFALAVVHTVAHLVNYVVVHESIVSGVFGTTGGQTGLVLMIALGLMWGFSSERIRKTGHFELFHSVHLLYWLFIAVLLAHGPVYWMWACVPLLAYLAEGVARMAVRSEMVELHTKVLASGVTKLSFPAPPGWKHRAGDYLFLRVPTIAKSEWHPFTISSAPERVGAMPSELISPARARIEQPEAGTLKGAAPSLIERAPMEELTVHVRSLGNWTGKLHELARRREGLDWPARLHAHVDGPYGSPSGHIFTTKYAVLIGAGIGVTPFAAILDSILRRHRAGDESSRLEKVHFVWVNRDQHAFEWFTELLAQLEAEDLDSLLDLHIYMTLGRAHIDAAALELARELIHARTQRDIVTGLSARTHFGRPDWEQLLGEIQREHGSEPVEVFMCGPWGLTRALRPMCRKLGMGFHYEVF